ncbi:MAG TPA: sigma factor-like helix-turn-helix DNA-binding protein [Nocardioidaceae bacterium]|nr:sigma factor-like helix-turn-helix DNA-binding protein [Nocardioidaceae bacterium]
MDDEEGGGSEERRGRLTAVAYRILGSASEADDAVREARSRLRSPGADDVPEPDAWLTSVVHTCLRMLRSHAASGMAGPAPGARPGGGEAAHPGQEAMLSESLAEALFVVLQTLAPAERVAFVLHDLFATPYDEIATMLGRSPTATRQLAGRARRRVLAPDRSLDADRTVHGRVVEAFLTASRDGDVEEMAWLLHPDAVLRADRTAAAGADSVVVGADAVADALVGRAGTSQPALLDGFTAAAATKEGMSVVLAFTVLDGRVAEVELIADPAVLATLDLELGSGTP